MNTLELKGMLHEMFAEVTDPEILLKLKHAFIRVIKKEQEGEAELDGWSDLPPEFQERLMKAYNDFKNEEKGIPHEEVMLQARERFKNYPI